MQVEQGRPGGDNDSLFTRISSPVLENYFPVPILREFNRNRLKMRPFPGQFSRKWPKYEIFPVLFPVAREFDRADRFGRTASTTRKSAQTDVIS
jgi:hypothetical protein